MPGRILVADADPWTQRSVATLLGQRGYHVSLAGDPAGAFAVASKSRPDVIVTSAGMPTIDGWAWWERLRALPASADTPIVFLVARVDEAAAIRGAGPNDRRLGTPFRVEDLERAIATSLRANEAREASGRPAVSKTTPPSAEPKASRGYRPLSAFRGAIDQISLPGVLVLLEMERKTGVLLIERGEATARLFLRKGRVIRADSDRPTLKGALAVYEALTWPAGSFDFLAGDVGDVDEIAASTTFLLMEGARRVDEANERRRSSPESKL
jgi:CheY-like chemotaxis protein